MPEETNPAPSQPANEAAKEPRIRRISTKPARKAGEKKIDGTTEPKPDATSERGPDEENTGGSPESGKPPETKRPNRRRRGKGKPQGKDTEKEFRDEEPGIAQPEPVNRDGEMGEPKEKPPAPGHSPNAQRPPQKPRHKADPEKVAKNAWKIYLAEVSEEGVALIGDNDARELARRCFRLSEIFLEEADRRS